MKRRDFLTLSAAMASVPFSLSAASGALPYSPGLVTEHLAVGDTVFLDFKARWCGTCRAQEKVISALKSTNPDYEKHIVFIDVDWDLFGKSDLVAQLNIPRRSTLVVLKKDDELGRIVAGTGRKNIKSLMDIALSAATL
jgi:thiol-disulfide isomerase/thioredoxin